MQNCSSLQACVQSHSLDLLELFHIKSLTSFLPLDLLIQCDSSSTACTPSSPPHSSSLWTHEKKSITLNGRGRGGPLLSPFPSGMLTCQRSVSAGWKSLPHPAIHLSHKGNFTGRQAFSLPFFLAAPRRLSIPSSLPLTHSHTHSQAVISILMDARENVNVTKWETWDEKKKKKTTMVTLRK